MKHLTLEKISDFSKFWYEFSHSVIPELETQDFIDFVLSSSFLLFEVGGERANEFTIKIDKNCPTAYVDLNGKVVALSPQLFLKQFYADIFGEEAIGKERFLATSIVNGLIVHEALHIKHTDKGSRFRDLDPEALFAEYERERYWLSVVKMGKRLVLMINNIFEDRYIESQLSGRSKKWVNMTNDSYFPEAGFDELVAKIDDEGLNLERCLDFITSIKNENNEEKIGPKRIKEILGSELYKQLLKGDNLDVHQGHRCQIVLDICDEIYRMFSDEIDKMKKDSESEGESGAEGSAGSSEDSEGEPSDSDESSAQPGSNFNDTPDGSEIKSLREIEAGETAAEDLEDALGKTLEEINKEIKAALEEIKREASDFKEFSTGSSAKVSWLSPVFVDVCSQGFRDVEAPFTTNTAVKTKDFGFIRNLVAMTVVNRSAGIARKSGSMMVKQRITRIATDGKIFAKREADHMRRDKPEFIINVDLSGSTSGDVANKEMGAAKEVSKALRQANISHSVYAHTAYNLGDGYHPYIIHIFSHNMEVTNNNWEERFQIARRIDLAQNIDGVVIDELSNKFTESPTKKIMINLSDGTPSCPGYKGEIGILHTIEMIKKARNKNISIFSLSVVRSVVENNNRIYGKNFNIDASKDVSKQFKKLIEQIV